MTIVWTMAVLDVVFLAAAFGLRTWVQWRRTRDSGWRLGRPGSTAEIVARLAMFGSAALLAISLALPERGGAGARVVGVAVCVAAIGFVVVSQLHMGASWRIGVDPDERTALVTTGVYRWVRNPIYSGMVLFAVGQVVARPNVANVAAAVAMAIGAELQVRSVEEPYLVATHGDEYLAWAATAGRFVPGLGAQRPV